MLTVVKKKISDLHFDPANARKHGERNLLSIRASLLEFGQVEPLVVQKSTGKVIGGNGRLEVMIAEGMTECDVVEVDVSDSKAAALGIALNRTAELAEWDDEILTGILNGLATEDIDLLEASGFNEGELDELLKELGEEAVVDVVEDEVPEPPVDPITKQGDLWLLGDHRLLCGDSTKAEDVDRLMVGAKADLWLTDPPYNVDYTGGTKDALKIENDSMEDAEFKKFLIACFTNAFASMKPGASFYVWHADSEGFNFRCSIWDCGEKVRQCLIWVKSSLVIGRQDYQWQHEPCLYGWKAGASHFFSNSRSESTVIDDAKPVDIGKMKKSELLEFAIDLRDKMKSVPTTILREPKPVASHEHPTMKPVKLIARLMRNSTKTTQIVYDPFLGSGTTLIAAEQLGRKCYGIEISPQYCDVIVKRWEALTGQKAVLQ